MFLTRVLCLMNFFELELMLPACKPIEQKCDYLTELNLLPLFCVYKFYFLLLSKVLILKFRSDQEQFESFLIMISSSGHSFLALIYQLVTGLMVAKGELMAFLWCSLQSKQIFYKLDIGLNVDPKVKSDIFLLTFLLLFRIS